MKKLSVLDIIDCHIDVISLLKEAIYPINDISERIRNTFKLNKKIYLFGNGGSAADSQHIAAELVGRFQKERKGLPAIAFTTDTSILTAVGNDYGYEHIFSRQVEAHVLPGDVVIGISTSGNSSSVVEAIKKANEIGAYTVGLTGGAGGMLKELCDTSIVVPSSNTARIQEAHILIGHILCELVEE